MDPRPVAGTPAYSDGTAIPAGTQAWDDDHCLAQLDLTSFETAAWVPLDLCTAQADDDPNVWQMYYRGQDPSDWVFAVDDQSDPGHRQWTTQESPWWFSCPTEGCDASGPEVYENDTWVSWPEHVANLDDEQARQEIEQEAQAQNTVVERSSAAAEAASADDGSGHRCGASPCTAEQEALLSQLQDASVRLAAKQAQQNQQLFNQTFLGSSSPLAASSLLAHGPTTDGVGPWVQPNCLTSVCINVQSGLRVYDANNP